MMPAVRNGVTFSGGCGLAALLAVLMAAFCLSSVAPAAAADPGCPGFAPSLRTCAQPGAPDPIPVIVQGALPVQGTEVPTGWLPLAPLPQGLFQLHAGPSTPRAPPFSRA